jgi:hypothetical protein
LVINSAACAASTQEHDIMKNEYDANRAMAQGAHRQIYRPAPQRQARWGIAALVLWISFGAALGVILALALTH